MQQLKQPKPLVMSGDMAVNWKRFKESFEMYLVATEGNKKGSEIRAAIFKHVIGEEAIEILENLEIPANEHKNAEKLIEALDTYFKPVKNKSVERHKFNTRNQQANESFDEYLLVLKAISSNCEFGAMKDELVKDRIVCGILDQKIRNRLLTEAELTLNRAIEICKGFEQNEIHAQLFMKHEKIDEISRRGAANWRTNSNNDSNPWKKSGGNSNQREIGKQFSNSYGNNNRIGAETNNHASRGGNNFPTNSGKFWQGTSFIIQSFGSSAVCGCGKIVHEVW